MKRNLVILAVLVSCAFLLTFAPDPTALVLAAGVDWNSKSAQTHPARTEAFSVLDQWYTNFPSGAGGGLNVSRTNPLTVFASGYFAPQRSTDGGETWSNISSNLPTSYDNQALWVASDDDTVIYLSAYNNGWYKTTNGGTSWQNVFVSPAASIPGWSALSDSDPDVLYMQTYSALYGTADGGATWPPLGPTCTGRVTGVDSQNANIAYFVGNDLYKTIDGGLTCFMVNPLNLHFVTGEFGNGGRLYGFTQYPHLFYQSADGGANWIPTLNNGFPTGADVWGYAVDPNNRDHMVISATGFGIRESCDGGNNWHALNTGYPLGVERSVVIGFDTPASIYATTNGNGVWQYHPSVPACPSTAVSLAGLKSRLDARGNVVIQWKSTTEIHLAGFNLWRQTAKNGWSKLNRTLLQAKHAGAAQGAKYRFKDKRCTRHASIVTKSKGCILMAPPNGLYRYE